MTLGDFKAIFAKQNVTLKVMGEGDTQNIASVCVVYGFPNEKHIINFIYFFFLHSFNVDLWAEYTFLFVLLTLLLPCFWVAYIWEEIIDPHYESESIPEPEHRILRFFYSISGPITRSLGIRTLIYIIISCLFVTTAVTDVVSNCQTLRHSSLWSTLHPKSSNFMECQSVVTSFFLESRELECFQ